MFTSYTDQAFSICFQVSSCYIYSFSLKTFLPIISLWVVVSFLQFIIAALSGLKTLKATVRSVYVLYPFLWNCRLGKKKKKQDKLKVENYVLLGKLSEDSSQADSLSEHSERLIQRGKEEARIYRSFATKTM